MTGKKKGEWAQNKTADIEKADWNSRGTKWRAHCVCVCLSEKEEQEGRELLVQAEKKEGGVSQISAGH